MVSIWKELKIFLKLGLKLRYSLQYQGTLRRAVPNARDSPVKAMHSDYGLDFDRLVTNTKVPFPFSAYRKKFEEIKANEFMLVNFWRPALPMSQKWRSQLLAFLDASNLSNDDIVRVELSYDGELITEITSLEKDKKHQFLFLSRHVNQRSGDVETISPRT